MKITIRHEIHCDIETYWSKVFFDPEYNRALYRDELEFPQWEVIEQRDEPGAIVRRTRVVPKNDAPAAIQKLSGGTFSYVEEGRFDKATRRYAFRVVPNSMADKVRSDGEVRAESASSPGRIHRVVDMNIEVKIFGVGGMVEGFVSRSMQDSYARAAAFTNKWIAKQGL